MLRVDNNSPVVGALVRCGNVTNGERCGGTEGLPAQSKAGNQLLVAVYVCAVKVGQVSSPLSHQHGETSPGVEIVLVEPQVLREPTNPGGEDGYLNFRGTGIAAVGVIPVYNLPLLLFI